MRRLLASVLLLAAVLLLPGPAGAGQADSSKIDYALQAMLAQADAAAQIPVIVTLTQQADLAAVPGGTRAERRQQVISRLHAVAQRTQAGVLAWLAERQTAGSVTAVDSFWIFNGLAVTATPDEIRLLAERPEVRLITADEVAVVPDAAVAYATPEANLAVIHAQALWDLGWRGQGVIVATLDSGADASHPDLASRWRGGSNSWYDPYGQHPAGPYDKTGHGSWTMGVMVAGDAGGTSVGVAPDARWIAARIFNDAGSATASAIHLAFQWVLDPDNNPATADGADVVNNSWSYGYPGCNLEFQQDLRSLRAAGILPVFAAGNYGPGSPSSVSPANYPEAFAVGATDNNNSIYSGSGRGPSACGEASTIYPDAVAPGVNIRTTDLFGGYTLVTGTSLSAPHAAGALALLLSAYPDLTADQQAAALTNSAVDLGAAGADNTFGAGRIDALAAYQWLQAGGAITPAATWTATQSPTATAMPLPSATPTATAMLAPTWTPTATATATRASTATPTGTPKPTATPSPAASLHSGDLDRSAATGSNGWTAKVTIQVHDGAHAAVTGVEVTGSWSGASGATSCTTDATGRCAVTTGTISRRTASVSFSISGAVLTGYVYQASANHDPDGDSNGTKITVNRP